MKRKVQKPKIISHDIELHTAMIQMKKVAVYHKANLELIEPGGVIEQVSPEAIKINGSYFMRENCQFWI